MINFFRHLRLKLIEQDLTNKTVNSALVKSSIGTYFKYAIGEIILVVIGILIALQINNWNEQRKNISKEVQYLNSFKTDLLANKNELERVISKSEFTSKCSDSLLNHISGDSAYLYLNHIESMILASANFTVYQTFEGTVQDIIGSGTLDIIKNDSIRKAIGSWHANLKGIREWEKLDKDGSSEYYRFLQHNMPLFQLNTQEFILTESEKERLFNNQLFLNLILTRYRTPRILNENYKNELPRLNKLINLIDIELNN
ncbi:hypothetical protein FJ651_14600 [Paucihalobacter ruber]|uniref:Uncharacterized protein n=1 Tax=Paucihalobacter ruber TaxID=2567861 RepID=A0A506PBS2_9FLAO|nr:DUF6090 family protein [Paucihalobacter ruber]TPV31421.1 hypothetical protein FJ651_14600 [Paucihalobacter ruber]